MKRTTNNLEIEAQLLSNENFLVRQVYEVAEHFGYETRNKYQILDVDNNPVFFVAEQQKGILNFLFRQWLGHWRPYTLNFYNGKGEKLYEAKHPFSIFFQRLELYDSSGQQIGSFQQRFSLLRYYFTVHAPNGRPIMTMKTKIRWFLLWNFPFYLRNRNVASVDKKFSGLFTEFATDRDNFLINFNDVNLTFKERLLVLSSSIFIDLMYFEKKSK